MTSILAVALFCDDIREEVGGSVSIVGVAPDNALVPAIPFAIPKMGIYTRIFIPTERDPVGMRILLRHPTGEEVQLAEFSTDMVTNTIAAARSVGNPLAGLVAHALMAPFAINVEGRFLVVFRVDGEDERVIGDMHFKAQAPPEAPRTVSA